MEKTEVRTIYIKHEVYFGMTCFESDPTRIIASELRRDVSQKLQNRSLKGKPSVFLDAKI
jgi:hypothetical protein